MINYCTCCDSLLDSQIGFKDSLPYWFCRKCGAPPLNPKLDLHDHVFPDVLWFCDACDALLNVQEGFTDECGFWVCDVCMHINEISEEAIR